MFDIDKNLDMFSVSVPKGKKKSTPAGDNEDEEEGEDGPAAAAAKNENNDDYIYKNNNSNGQAYENTEYEDYDGGGGIGEISSRQSTSITRHTTSTKAANLFDNFFMMASRASSTVRSVSSSRSSISKSDSIEKSNENENSSNSSVHSQNNGGGGVSWRLSNRRRGEKFRLGVCYCLIFILNYLFV